MIELDHGEPETTLLEVERFARVYVTRATN